MASCPPPHPGGRWGPYRQRTGCPGAPGGLSQKHEGSPASTESGQFSTATRQKENPHQYCNRPHGHVTKREHRACDNTPVATVTSRSGAGQEHTRSPPCPTAPGTAATRTRQEHARSPGRERRVKMGKGQESWRPQTTGAATDHGTAHGRQLRATAFLRKRRHSAPADPNQTLGKSPRGQPQPAGVRAAQGSQRSRDRAEGGQSGEPR